MTVRTFTPPVSVDGIPVMVESSRTLPLVDVVFVLQLGSLAEPLALEGLARFLARTTRSGTKKLDPFGLEERIASLGGRLAIDVGTGHIRFHGSVIARNLDPFVRTIASIVVAPALRVKDVDRVRREALADLASNTDDDRWLASRAFRRTLFGRHPLARSIAGTSKSLASIKRGDLVSFHEQALARDRLFVGMAGEVDEAHAHALVHELFGGIPARSSKSKKIADPVLRKGRKVVVVDKPDRTQCQIVAGTLGSQLHDPLIFPLHVANTAFGGMFSGRLVDEIRVKRGYSYGASSRLGQDVVRDAWTMSSFPTAEQAVDCARTMVSLAESFVAEGLSEREIRAAKSFLVNGRCFEDDTAHKRLDSRMDTVMHGLPVAHYTRFDDLVRKVDRKSANAAIRQRLDLDSLVLTIVGPASSLVAGLRELPGISKVEVRPHAEIE